MSPPDDALLRRLTDGSTVLSEVCWNDRIGSTNAEVARRARDGVAEGLLVLADEQTAGRGRQGRPWHAPPGTSLMGSLLLRPRVDPTLLPLLPLLIGLVLAEACDESTPDAELRLKWPNDLLADGSKCAGILVEAIAPEAVIVGTGINVDWRGVGRPDVLADATSLTEAAGRPVDRWRLLSAYADRLDERYPEWLRDPRAFLPAYRARCVTVGARVRVTQLDGATLTGTAVAVDDDGALRLDCDGEPATVRAGDVHHVRPVPHARPA
jgi:BirA family biotin operon repressor/biotin-[acetyl-CoA-carboxylase] ligase